MSTSYTCRESSVQKHGAAGGSSFPLQWNAIFRCCWHTVRQIPLTTLLRDIESRECRDSYQPPPSLFSFVKAQVHYCTFTWQFAWISQFPLAWNSWQHWATAIQKTIVQWQMTSTSTLSWSELEKPSLMRTGTSNPDVTELEWMMLEMFLMSTVAQFTS